MKRDRQGGIRVYVKTCCANAGNGDVGGECDVYQVPNEYVRDSKWGSGRTCRV